MGDSENTIRIVNHFNEVFNQHNVDAVIAAMTDDVVFENTSPFPDGTRYAGQQANREFWSEFFRNSPHARFETEEMFAAGDRCVVRWVYHWRDGEGKPGHIRGVDVFRVRDGKVTEKFAYVKG
jgi:ketosteroid isomerase-like protein